MNCTLRLPASTHGGSRGEYFGSVDFENAWPREMEMGDAARIGQILALSSNSACIRSSVDRMIQLQSHLEKSAEAAGKALARLEENIESGQDHMEVRDAFRADLERKQEAVSVASGSRPLALLHGWWRNKKPTMTLTLIGEPTQCPCRRSNPGVALPLLLACHVPCALTSPPFEPPLRKKAARITSHAMGCSTLCMLPSMPLCPMITTRSMPRSLGMRAFAARRIKFASRAGSSCTS